MKQSKFQPDNLLPGYPKPYVLPALLTRDEVDAITLSAASVSLSRSDAMLARNLATLRSAK